MKFRGKVTAALAVVIAVSLFALVSCGAKNDAEILSALSEKYPKGAVSRGGHLRRCSPA